MFFLIVFFLPLRNTAAGTQLEAESWQACWEAKTMHFVSADVHEPMGGSDTGGTEPRGPTGHPAAAMQSSSSGILCLTWDSFYIMYDR